MRKQAEEMEVKLVNDFGGLVMKIGVASADRFSPSCANGTVHIN
jgi:hypothetical protein